jgi:CRP-like cAMP-binding protein
MKDALSTNIGTRLAKTINNIAHAYGRHTHDGLKIECHFSDSDIGEISGLPTDIITTHMRDWCDKGLISVKHGYITIHNPDELDRLESPYINYKEQFH